MLILKMFWKSTILFWCHKYHSLVKSTDNVIRPSNTTNVPGFSHQPGTCISSIKFPSFQATALSLFGVIASLPFMLSFHVWPTDCSISYPSMVAIILMNSVLDFLSGSWDLNWGPHVSPAKSLMTGLSAQLYPMHHPTKPSKIIILDSTPSCMLSSTTKDINLLRKIYPF